MIKSWQSIQITDYARLSVNPLRKLKFEQTVKPNPSKKTITLQLGDPSIFGNFPPAKESIDAFKNSVERDTYPYNISNGSIEARQAVADYSKHQSVHEISPNDVILTSGLFSS